MTTDFTLLPTLYILPNGQTSKKREINDSFSLNLQMIFRKTKINYQHQILVHTYSTENNSKIK